MKKVLYRAMIAFAFTLLVLLGWQGQSVEVTRAVEIQEADLADGRVVYEPGTSGTDSLPSKDSLPSLETFIQQVWDGQTGSVRGLYVSGLLALRVVQQPDGQIDFISYDEDSATEYQSPRQFGLIGLLAHNFLSGRFFFQILPGQILTIIYGDGQTDDFQVTAIDDYERLSELDLHSDFRSLQTDQIVSADQVFRDFYQGTRRLTLQTCLEKDGNWNWGIRMITALPVAP